MFRYEIRDNLLKYARRAIEGIEHTLDLEFSQGIFLKGNQADLHYRILNKEGYDHIMFVVSFSLEDDFLGVTVEYAKLRYIPSGEWRVLYVRDYELRGRIE